MQVGIIFDADGTLLDSTEMWMEAGARYLAGLGVTAEPALSERMFSMSIHNSACYLKEHYQLPQSPEEIIAGINASIRHFYQTEVRAKPGVLAFLQRLQAAGVPMTVATATDRPLIEDGLRCCGLRSYFQELFTCSEIGQGKEQPAIYLAACAHMRTDISKTWVFEDALHAAKTAKAAGFRVAAVFDPASRRDIAELRSISDLYLEDLCDMAQFTLK